jgi:bifunctional non-homologous end joining protein LigD
MSKMFIRLGTRDLVLSNLEKIYYPAAGYLKAQVLDYYRQIAPVLLPHIRNRPLTMKRYPEGTGNNFFLKSAFPQDDLPGCQLHE